MISTKQFWLDVSLKPLLRCYIVFFFFLVSKYGINTPKCWCTHWLNPDCNVQLVYSVYNNIILCHFCLNSLNVIRETQFKDIYI